MESVVEASPLDTAPEVETSKILKSLCHPTSTIPSRTSGQIVYGCALLLGELWEISLWWYSEIDKIRWECVSHQLRNAGDMILTTVFVCQDCHNEIQQTGCFKQQKNFVTDQIPRSRWQQVWFFLRLSCLACRQQSSCCVLTWTFLCAHHFYYLFLFLQYTCNTGLGSQPYALIEI